MKLKSFYTLTVVILFAAGILLWLWSQTVTISPVSFSQLPGWRAASVKKSLAVFKHSCQTFLNQDPKHRVGTQYLRLTASDWQPACRAAMLITPITDDAAKRFFEKWFTPIGFYKKKPLQGLFTGYYLPLLHGNLTKTKEYSIPIYGVPTDLVVLEKHSFNSRSKHSKKIGRLEGDKFLPYYTRKEINQGALNGKAPVLAWVNSPIDRVFLEIEGSGNIQLTNSERLFVGYANENGAHYTPIASVLIKKGIFTKDSASTKNMYDYFKSHPEEIDPILDQNQSFIFFRIRNQKSAVGAQGVELTAGYSLAVDQTWVPMGAPLWLATKTPTPHQQPDAPLQRLMVAQDTGGAIRGLIRGDVFWGGGKNAIFMASTMSSPGNYWLLLPKDVLPRLPKKIVLHK